MTGSKRWTLWGYKHSTGLLGPIKITAGSLQGVRAESRRRKADGWDTAVYAEGDEPTGFRLVITEKYRKEDDDATR